MRLTRHTDFALRILIQAAGQAADRPDERLSIAAVADAHGISRNHAMKVVNQLATGGLLTTVRGRGGGFTLARPAADITVGEVVRLTEPDIRPADCDNCVLSGSCGLTSILRDAVRSFLAELDDHSLAEAAAGTRLPILAPA